MSKAYQVRFLLPCEDPEHNVVKIMGRNVVSFEVPINLPDLHNIGYAKLLEIGKERENPEFFTPLKNTTGQKRKKVSSQSE